MIRYLQEWHGFHFRRNLDKCGRQIVGRRALNLFRRIGMIELFKTDRTIISDAWRRCGPPHWSTCNTILDALDLFCTKRYIDIKTVWKLCIYYMHSFFSPASTDSTVLPDPDHTWQLVRLQVDFPGFISRIITKSSECACIRYYWALRAYFVYLLCTLVFAERKLVLSSSSSYCLLLFIRKNINLMYYQHSIIAKWSGMFWRFCALATIKCFFRLRKKYISDKLISSFTWSLL